MSQFPPVALLFLACFPALCFSETSTAERKIAAANQALAANPKSLQAYNDLAAALCDRASESGDVAFFKQAQSALEHSFQIAPGDYSAQKIRVDVLFGLHQWMEASKLAKSLNRLVPDDVAVWGLLAEADISLGDYPQAEKATQWMFDLRPGTSAAFRIAAKLREVYGDLEGANDFVNDALQRIPQNDVESRAILMTESARLVLLNGDSKRASAILDGARRLFPACNELLRVSATIEKGAGRFQQAADLLGRRYERVRSAAALYEYAEMLHSAGRKTEAAAAFHNFERQAVSESSQPLNANRELIFYYTDYAAEPSKSLPIALSERAIRHDNETLDALAWALFRNGKLKEAKAEIQRALETGTRDPDILGHAKRISPKE